MVTNRELQARKDAAMPRGFGNLHPIYADRALDAELWDVESNRYIDFTSGIAVLNTGHLHPRVLAAVRRQLERFSHTCLQVVPYESAVVLAERLNRAAPGPSPKKTLFVTTGAEAIENAVKIAKCYTRRSEVIAFYGGFHGRTHMG
ncbi:MAG: aminotransferase class III-fold pyridoxal phosphate-dependent enzyme, partial [Vicinamibacteria bacterium]